MVYRHIDYDPRIMFDRRIESVDVTVGYRHIESVFELWFTDTLRMIFTYGLQTYLECYYNYGLQIY